MLKRLLYVLAGLWAAFGLTMAVIDHDVTSLWVALVPFIALVVLTPIARFVVSGRFLP